MIGLEVQAPKAPADLLKRLGKNAEKAMAIAIFRCAQRAEADIKDTIQSEFEPGTGNLMRSYKAVMLSKSGNISAAAASDLIYAKIQDEGSGYLPGGVVRPKNMKNLAIPAKDAKIPIGKWPRHWPKDALQFIPSKKEGVTGVLVEKLAKGQTGKGKLQYILKKTVKIEGKNYLEKARKVAEPEYPRIIEQELRELIEKSEAAASKAGK